MHLPYAELLAKLALKRCVVLTLALVTLLPSALWAQCLGAIAGTAAVANATWNPAIVPGTTTITVNGSTNGTTTMTLTSTTGLNVGLPITGPNIPPGTTIATVVNGTTITLSQAATGTGGPVPYDFSTIPYPNAFPNTAATFATTVPVSSGNSYCRVCPSLFSSNICTNQFVTAYLCIGNVYTISLCNSTPSFNSTLTITNAGYTTSYAYDDDGCGPVNGLSTITFVPTISQPYRFRVLNDPCSPTVPATNCGLIEITCSPAPPPPVNDNPCGATPLTVAAVCSYISTSTSWATQTNPPTAPACGGFAGSDVWYSAVVPASGALAIQTNQVAATNLAMAVYSAPGCAGPFTVQACNADIAVGVPAPFISFNLPALAGQTVYIRVWPTGGTAAGGSFEICAFEPIPPSNDNPCTATIVPVTVSCTTVSSTNESATATTGIPVPSCGGVAPYNDVWFTVTVPSAPPGAGVIINTGSAVLNNAAMAVYTTSVDCNGAFTQVGCNDPVAAGAMPALQVNQNGTTIVAGTVLYVRVWNQTAVFGPFTICATPTLPPPNNNPCGAISVPLEYGCLFTPFTNVNANNTPLTVAGEHANVPTTPSCDSPADNDVWFTVQVPNPVPVPSIVLDTDDGTMTDAAIGVYRVSSGSCAGGDLVLTQIACAVGGSTNGPNMPTVTLPTASLVANEVLYVRIWRQNATDGTFQLCARRSDVPPGACTYTLRMNDTGGDGWNGSSVQVCIDPPGPPPQTCTNYTITGSLGTINFSADVGAIITLNYTAVGGFQNQISYQLTTPGGGLLFGSGSNPATGIVYALTVNSTCNVPPAPDEDCAGAHHICLGSTTQNNNPGPGTGAVNDLTLANRGCLIANERQGVWYTFQVSTSGELGFTIDPFPYSPADYDYGVWGPYSSVTCPPPGPPLRCSWGDGPVLTGLNWVATDVTEGAFGDSWTRYIDVLAGEWYILFIDNFYAMYWGVPFDLTFQFQDGASIDCVLPVELLSFTGRATGTAVDLRWSTGRELASDHFIVERSTDGVRFAPIGRVEASGNSNSLLEYGLIDKDPVKGVNYYRLQQVDDDGTVETSRTISVSFHGRNAPVQVLPNPATESVEALFDLPHGEKIDWRMIDASGRIVSEGSTTALDGPDRLEIDLNAVESGAYALSLYGASEGFIGQARFVKR